MEIHCYNEHGLIEATIEGVRVTVPEDMANRHRQMIAAWEAQGNTIPPYVPPAADPNALPLPRREFRRALLHNGMDTSSVMAVIGAIPDPSEREEMTIWWEDTQLFQRHYPILVGMVAAAGLSEAQADAIWAYGVSLLNGD